MAALFIAKPPSIWASLRQFSLRYPNFKSQSIPFYERVSFFIQKTRSLNFTSPLSESHLLISTTGWGGRLLGKTHLLVLCSGLLIWAVNSIHSSVLLPAKMLWVILDSWVQSQVWEFRTIPPLLEEIREWGLLTLQNVLFNQRFALIDRCIGRIWVKISYLYFNIHSLCIFLEEAIPHPFLFLKRNSRMFFAVLPWKIFLSYCLNSHALFPLSKRNSREF